MKLWAFIKLSLKSIIKQLPTFIFVFALFPVILGLALSFMQGETFLKSGKSDAINVYIKDEDNTESSKILTEFLNNDSLKSIINVVKKSESTKIDVIIPKGYEDSIKSMKKSEIIVKQKESGNRTALSMVKSIIEDFTKEFSKESFIKNKIDKKDLDEDSKKLLFKNIKETLNDIKGENPIKTAVLTKKREFTAYEYYSITFMSYMLVMAATSLVAGGYLQRENGVTNRILSSPITKVQVFNYNFISSVMFGFLISLTYIGIYRCCNLSFKGNFSLLMLTIVLNGLFMAALAGFVNCFFKKNIAMVFLNLILLVQLFLNGSIIPVEKMGNLKILSKLSKISPDIIITKMYKRYMVYNSFDSMKKYMLIYLLVSLVMYSISIIAIKKKWGDV